MNKALFLFVGKSAAGKTKIAQMLIKEGLTQVYSYTTRPPRYDGEIGHVCISNAEFDELQNVVAYTERGDYRYCTTLDQIKDADIYVVDPYGVDVLLDNYNALDREVHIVYFSSDIISRIGRMRARGDDDKEIVSRLLIDESYDWYEDLKEIINDHIVDNENYRPHFHSINANESVQTVFAQVKRIIKN